MGIFQEMKKAVEIKVQEYIAKANSNINALKNQQLENYPKALINYDNDELLDQGFRERNTTISFDILRSMAMKDSIIASILFTRSNQIKTFGQPQPDKYSHGFKIILRDEKSQPTPEDKENIKLLESWILNTGSTDNRPERYKRSFPEFLSIIVRDILTYDQVSIELVPAQDGSLSYFVPVSSGSIRFASKKFDYRNDNFIFYLDGENPQQALSLEKRDEDDNRQYDYVQVYRGRVVRGFYHDELIFRMMNPTNELDSNGYSIGPLETLANIVSYHLYAEAHNKLFFVQGFASRGIIHIEGEIAAQQLEEFRKQWREQISGATNSFRTPVWAGSKINWIPLSTNNRDMEWSSWIDYLIKIMCSIYSIAPQEINFDNTRSHGATLGDSGKRNDIILKDSKDRGLNPLLKFIETIVNEDLIKKFDESIYEKYKFIFCGLDAESKQEELERQEKEVKIFKTVNEIRAEHDMEPLVGGDILLDTNYLKFLSGNPESNDNVSNEKSENIDNDKEDNLEREKDDLYDDEKNIDLGNDSNNDKKEISIEKSLSKSKSVKLLKVEYYQ